MHKVSAMRTVNKDFWDSLFGDFFGDARARTAGSYAAKAYDDRRTISVDVPGCGPEDVEVTHDGEVLSLSWRAGRAGSLRFSIPEGTDAGAISAKVEKGVLTATLPFLRRRDPEKKTVRVQVT